MRLSIIIPARNEEKNLKKITSLLIKTFNREINEIIVVNDCSTDNTQSILKKLSQKNKKIVGLQRKNNPGVGNAIIFGLKALSEKSDYVLLLDCDFIENIQNIKTMIKSSSLADGILGSRYMKKGKLTNYPILKKVANRSFHAITRFVLRIPYYDLTNNFKLYKKSIIDDILPHLKSSGFSINAETGIYPILFGYKLKELPVVWIGRTPQMGKSSFKIIQAGPGYAKVLIRAMKLKRREARGAEKLQKKESEHFDKLIETTGETYYGNLRPIASTRFSRKADSILKVIRTYKNPKILELGCGTGILSRYLLSKNPNLRIEGVDISPKAISVANKTLKKYKFAHFQTGDALNLPFKKNTFDVVIGNSILHHIPLLESVAEVKRVIKPGGKIWFCEPNILNPQIYLEKNSALLKRFMQDSEDETAFSRWFIKKFLKKNGFTNITAKPYEFLHPLLPGGFLGILVPLVIFLERVPLFNELAGTMQVTAEVKKRN